MDRCSGKRFEGHGFEKGRFRRQNRMEKKDLNSSPLTIGTRLRKKKLYTIFCNKKKPLFRIHTFDFKKMKL